MQQHAKRFHLHPTTCIIKHQFSVDSVQFKDPNIVCDSVLSNINMKSLNQESLAKLFSEAKLSTRKRMNHNFHGELNDNVQRFFNAMQPGTYVRPHCHHGDNRWEFFVIVSGEAVVVTFDATGKLSNRLVLNPHSANVAIEIPGDTWHTLAAIQPNTLLFECKTGPYQKLSDKDFAQWAPPENNNKTQNFIEWFINGELESSPPT